MYQKAKGVCYLEEPIWSAMRFVILSRGPYLYSTQRLFNAVRKRGHAVTTVDHTLCTLLVADGQNHIFYEGSELKGVDAVIPRIGPSVTIQGAALIRQLELQGAVTSSSSEALLLARNKFQTLQVLSGKGLRIPKTAVPSEIDDLDLLAEQLGGFPLVIKLQGTTHGAGVILVEHQRQLSTTVEAFLHLKQQILMQEFIREASGTDVRALVVNDKVVAAMERTAQKGEFRANLHQGGEGRQTKLTKNEDRLAVRAAKALGLEVAGVDILRSSRGPLLLEVNASPGLEGIENASGVNIADKIVKRMEDKVRENRIRHADSNT